MANNAKLLPDGGELQLVTFATPGPLGFYLGDATNGPTTLGMVTYPLPFSRYRRFFAEGVTLAFAGVQASESNDVLSPAIKHRSRLFWHVAEKRMRDVNESTYHPHAIPVVMNGAGVGDTAIGSVLVVAGNTVRAAEGGSVQDSISVRVVEELCSHCGYLFERTRLDLRPLCQAASNDRSGSASVTELLLAGTGFCVAGVREFASPGETRSFTWPGPVFTKLLSAWSDLVGVDISAQMLEIAKQ